MAQSLSDAAGYVEDGWYPGKKRKNPLLSGLATGLSLGIYNPDNRASSKLNKAEAARRIEAKDREEIAALNKQVRSEQIDEATASRQAKLTEMAQQIRLYRPDLSEQEAMRLAAGPMATGATRQTAANQADEAEAMNAVETAEARRPRLATQAIEGQEAELARSRSGRATSENTTNRAKAFAGSGGPQRQAAREMQTLDADEVSELSKTAEDLFALDGDTQRAREAQRQAAIAQSQAAAAGAGNALTVANSTAQQLADPATAAAVAQSTLDKPLYSIEPGQEITTALGRKVRGANQLMQNHMGEVQGLRYQYDDPNSNHQVVPAQTAPTNSFIIPRARRPLSN